VASVTELLRGDLDMSKKLERALASVVIALVTSGTAKIH